MRKLLALWIFLSAPIAVANELPKRYSLYTVQRGDTLQSISQKHFDTTRRWWELKNLNADRLHSPNALEPGIQLLIPRAGMNEISREKYGIARKDPKPLGRTLASSPVEPETYGALEPETETSKVLAVPVAPPSLKSFDSFLGPSLEFTGK